MAAQATALPPGPGISAALARERASLIQDPRYELAFSIPERSDRPVLGEVAIRFTLTAAARIVLDFARPRDAVRAVRAGSRQVPVDLVNGHLVVPASATQPGANDIRIDFVAGDEALNRRDDLLYTLFVPARAHCTFPAFDQPNLKARFRLTLEVPQGWHAVSNGVVTETRRGASRAVVQFAETEPIPPYLFAFAAGAFVVETAVRDGRELRVLHRETDAGKIARNLDAVCDLHASALRWLEDYTSIPYPWGKFDIVLLPSFQFGGMEHPGAIFYNASNLLLEPSATQNQHLDRASLIAHETAHMWFGDLVTMAWFDDVWMKEVFANFMAAKIVNPAFPELGHDLRFLLAHHPRAYHVDRTAGANPVRQPLENLSDAGQLYGPIIYQKAPVAMRQLELLIGADALRDGLRDYLRRHRFGNATWPDLIRLLDRRTTEDLAAWSRAWIDARGRPEFACDVATDARGTTDITLTASDPFGRGLAWPQRLSVTVVSVTGDLSHIPVFVRGPVTRVAARPGPRPAAVLPGGQGLGYGLFRLDPETREYLLRHLDDLADPLTRGVAWVTLWENVLERVVAPAAFVDLALRAVSREADEQNLERALAYLTSAFWRHLTLEERLARAPRVEDTLRAGLDSATTTSGKAAWFGAYRKMATTPSGLTWLERLWRGDEVLQGLPLAESDQTALACDLAVREVPASRAICQRQLERIDDPDRRARFAFIAPALSEDPEIREGAFDRLRDVRHRQHEPWVVESLAYLNHPLRQVHARRFVRPALELLPEIQRTGDIFFPTRWIEAVLGGHSSPETAAIVQDVLADQPAYPQRLRWVILVASDELFRAARTSVTESDRR